MIVETAIYRVLKDQSSTPIALNRTVLDYDQHNYSDRISDNQDLDTIIRRDESDAMNRVSTRGLMG